LGRIQQRYIEIYSRKSIIDKFITEGVQYEKQRLVFFLVKLLREPVKLYSSLTDIHYLLDGELEKDLKEALDHFGYRS
jgi:hypothetical protein